MDEKNINISKSEEEFLEIMENRSHITADQLHNLKEDEECLQACSDLAEIVIEMQKKQNMLAIDVRNELADFHNKHSKNDRRKKYTHTVVGQYHRCSGNCCHNFSFACNDDFVATGNHSSVSSQSCCPTSHFTSE